MINDYYYSIAAQNFGHLLGKNVLYSIVGFPNQFVICKVEKINKKLIISPLHSFEFTWVNISELPTEFKNCPVIYNY